MTRDRGFEGGTRLANAFNQDTVSYFRIRRAASLGLLIGLILVSAPAAAEVYPVSGVWTVDTDFPAAAYEACFAVKTFGVEAVSKNSISEMIIFAKVGQYSLKTPLIENLRQEHHAWIVFRTLINFCASSATRSDRRTCSLNPRISINAK
jgi:hypothetical protein